MKSIEKQYILYSIPYLLMTNYEIKYLLLFKKTHDLQVSHSQPRPKLDPARQRPRLRIKCKTKTPMVLHLAISYSGSINGIDELSLAIWPAFSLSVWPLYPCTQTNVALLNSPNVLTARTESCSLKREQSKKLKSFFFGDTVYVSYSSEVIWPSHKRSFSATKLIEYCWHTAAFYSVIYFSCPSLILYCGNLAFICCVYIWESSFCTVLFDYLYLYFHQVICPFPLEDDDCFDDISSYSDLFLFF